MFESTDRVFNDLVKRNSYLPETILRRGSTPFDNEEYRHLLLKSCEAQDFSYAMVIPREMLLADAGDAELYDKFWDHIKKYGSMTPERFKDLIGHTGLGHYNSALPLQEMADLTYANITAKYWLKFFMKGRDQMMDARAVPSDLIPKLHQAIRLVSSLWTKVTKLPSIYDKEYRTSFDGAWDEVNGTVSWGFRAFDEELGGVRPREIALLAGEPGTGKTFILCKKAADWARQGCRVGFVSCEMAEKVIQQRIEACLAHFDSHIFRRKAAPKDEAEIRRRITESLAECRRKGGDIYYFPKTERSLESVKQRAKELNLDVLLVDGLYLMRSDSAQQKKNPLWEQMKAVADGMVEMANDLSIPIFASTQYNREARGMDYDNNAIGYSSAFAQNVDAIISLEREPVAPDIRYLCIRKNRNGSVGVKVQLNIDWHSMKFTVLDSAEGDAEKQHREIGASDGDFIRRGEKTKSDPTLVIRTPDGSPLSADSISGQPLTKEEKVIGMMAVTSANNILPKAKPSWEGEGTFPYGKGDVENINYLRKSAIPCPPGPSIIRPNEEAKVEQIVPMSHWLPVRAKSLIDKENLAELHRFEREKKSEARWLKGLSVISLPSSVKHEPFPKVREERTPKRWKVKLPERLLGIVFSTDFPEELKIRVSSMGEMYAAYDSMLSKKVTRKEWTKWFRSVWVCDKDERAGYIIRDRNGLRTQEMLHSQKALDDLQKKDDEDHKDIDPEWGDRRYTVHDKKKVAKYGGLDIGGAKVKHVEREV